MEGEAREKGCVPITLRDPGDERSIEFRGVDRRGGASKHTICGSVKGPDRLKLAGGRGRDVGGDALGQRSLEQEGAGGSRRERLGASRARPTSFGRPAVEGRDVLYGTVREGKSYVRNRPRGSQHQRAAAIRTSHQMYTRSTLRAAPRRPANQQRGRLPGRPCPALLHAATVAVFRRSRSLPLSAHSGRAWAGGQERRQGCQPAGNEWNLHGSCSVAARKCFRSFCAQPMPEASQLHGGAFIQEPGSGVNGSR